jgi:mRNA-degrading endonuclease RelE of RelBE toxin-antitoxin system
MQFLIADTFTDSLAKLTNEEQKAVKTTAFDLQLNPESPGFCFHKLDRAKDKNFWAIRVSSDLRLILHRTTNSLLLCYVDHHDKAYAWAERRKLETHPRTGAAQIVEIRETILEIKMPVYIPAVSEDCNKKVLANCSEEQLLGYGVPTEWITELKQANENNLLEIIDHLPREAAEAVLQLATGNPPGEQFLEKVLPDSFNHPDAKSRFRVMANAEELQRALDFPWDKWSIFLHPEQQKIVDTDFEGAARVAGTAGTGKTVVVLHRAVRLAQSNENTRVLIVTFSNPLAKMLQVKLNRLVCGNPRLAERIDVHSFDSIGQRFFKQHFRSVKVAGEANVEEIITQKARKFAENKFTLPFLITEWHQVIDLWQLKSWVEYKDFVRLGRKTRLLEGQRKSVWLIFEAVLEELSTQNLITRAELFTELGKKLNSISSKPFEHILVDESQDINAAQMRFLAGLMPERNNPLFLAGDLGQRIFQQPYSWSSFGIKVKGRCYQLKVNYRTSHQIRKCADLLLDRELFNSDGEREIRFDTVSVFNGPEPTVLKATTAEEEISKVKNWLLQRITDGILPHEMGLFVRSERQLSRASKLMDLLAIPYRLLDERIELLTGFVSVSTMHLAKGLEFKAVVVMACDDEVLPLQERIETAGDDSDLKEIYDTERQLLYVACTRARDWLIVSGVNPVSEFLNDLEMKRL